MRRIQTASAFKKEKSKIYVWNNLKKEKCARERNFFEINPLFGHGETKSVFECGFEGI